MEPGAPHYEVEPRVGARRDYDNVATLPIDSTTVFIGSTTQGWNRVQSPPSRQNELLCPVQVLLDAYKAGRIFGYGQVFELCRSLDRPAVAVHAREELVCVGRAGELALRAVVVELAALSCAERRHTQQHRLRELRRVLER